MRNQWQPDSVNPNDSVFGVFYCSECEQVRPIWQPIVKNRKVMQTCCDRKYPPQKFAASMPYSRFEEAFNSSKRQVHDG